MSPEEEEKRVCDYLDGLGIKYTIHHHKAVFTVAEVEENGLMMPGLNLKNLLIRDKRDKTFFLVILEDGRRFERKEFSGAAGWSAKLCFATPEQLMNKLGLTPGSVSPFGIMNDPSNEVTIVLDPVITAAPDDELLNFHPNTNTATLSLTKSDFIRFLDAQGNKYV